MDDPHVNAPRSPENRPTPPRRGSLLSIVLALTFAVLLSVGLVVVTMGVFGPVLVVFAGMVALAAFHYFVWGWWLSKAIRRQVEEEQRSEDSSPGDR